MLQDSAPGSPFESLPVTVKPDDRLLTYYLLSSLPLGPFFFVGFVPLYFRFRSMRYEIDDEGITMRWGILFRREISLTYTRIQDIHLSSNVVERWLGLGSIQVQTASGSASAEMTIQGLPYVERLRTFLYDRMRGARDSAAQRLPSGTAAPGGLSGELAETLREIAGDVRAIRTALAPRETDA